MMQVGSSREHCQRFVGVDYDFAYDYLDSKDMIVVGGPERCSKMAKRFGEEVTPAFI